MKNLYLLHSLSLSIILFLLAGCSTKPIVSKKQESYLPTSKVTITFENEKVPAQCKVFSQRLMVTPRNVTGQQIQTELLNNARQKGADVVLLGLARENLDDQDEYQFFAYGPEKPFSFHRKWGGWTYGFRDWQRNGGDIVPMDYNALNDQQNPFYHSLYIQNIYLTCQLGPSPKHQQD